jgi:hypothetical protein
MNKQTEPSLAAPSMLGGPGSSSMLSGSNSGLPASFYRPRLKRATVTYGGSKRRSSVSKDWLAMRKPAAAANGELEVSQA